MLKNIGLESSWGCKRMHAIGEQRPKWTRSGAAAEADASGEHAAAAEAGAIDHGGSSSSKRTQTGAAVEADANGPGSSSCQLIRSGCKRRAAAEVDAIGEQQLCTESCPVLDYSR